MSLFAPMKKKLIFHIWKIFNQIIWCARKKIFSPSLHTKQKFSNLLWFKQHKIFTADYITYILILLTITPKKWVIYIYILYLVLVFNSSVFGSASRCVSRSWPMLILNWNLFRCVSKAIGLVRVRICPPAQQTNRENTFVFLHVIQNI